MSNIVDYIPTVCHFDRETLLTKDGSLIQIIKVSGFEKDDDYFQTVNLRDAVREAITAAMDTQELAIYLHVVRERRNMRPHSDKLPPMQGFPKAVDDAWCRKNNWDKQLVNILYISLVSYPIKVKQFSLTNLIPALLKKKFFTQCAQQAKILNKRADSILTKLQRFGASKLKIIEQDGQAISELTSFYRNLIHLKEQPTPVVTQNLAEQLGDVDIKYHLNTLELTDADNTKQFAAVYTVKCYHELLPEVYDKFLQLGQQFILTQCFYPVPGQIALHNYKPLKEIIDISGDQIIAEASGLSRFFAANQNGATDYCVHQISIVIHSDDYEFFTDKVAKAVKVLQGIGIAIVREDYNMARVFWSQLPGNLKYMARPSYIDTAVIGGFTAIHHKKIGRYIDSKWGPPVTMFRNIEGNPFYFTFHINDNGNTLMIGPAAAGKSALARFLITQSFKVQPRLIYLDLEGTAEKFMDALGGVYLKLPHAEESPFKIDPFNLDTFAGNISNAQNWLQQAIAPQDIGVGQYTEFFRILAEALYNNDLPAEHASKHALLESLINASADEVLIAGYQEILGSPIFANLFATDELDLFDSSDILAFDLASLLEKPTLLELFLPLLLEKVLTTLDGRPTIILLNRCIHLYNASCFAPRIANWLQDVSNKNAIALLLTHYEDTLAHNKFMQNTLPHFATKIFFADKYATQEYRKLFMLNEDELYTIKSYEKERRMFLLKQQGENTLGAINLSGLDQNILKALL